MDDRFPSNAILLAAGLGKRMLPLSTTTPKPLLKVQGQALIDHVAQNFLAEGVTSFAINAHHHFDQLANHVDGMQVRFPQAHFALSNEKDQLLDTGGGAKKALQLIKGDPVFVANTDIFWPLNSDTPLKRMHAQFIAGADIVLLCAAPARATGFRRSHDFCLAPDKRITTDRGNPVIYAGVALLSRAVLDDAPQGPFPLSDLFYDALEQKTLHGVLLDAPWLHVGDPEAIVEAESALKGQSQ